MTAAALAVTAATSALPPPCGQDASICQEEHEFYWQNPDTCECECAIFCAGIYSVDSENCRCVPISGEMACDPIYDGEFCQNGVPMGAITNSTVALALAITASLLLI